MSIPLLSPKIYHKEFDSGVTKPSLLTCQNILDKSSEEYVVKIKANLTLGKTSLACELIASQLASILEIPTPEAALILIEKDFVDSIQNEAIAKSFYGSLGINFGTKYMRGFTTWVPNMSISSFQIQIACEILAFDALIKNPDRSLVHNKPNVLAKGDSIMIIDHEKAFSFLIPLLGQRKYEPWEISEEFFIKNHLYYNNLKKLTTRKEDINFEVIQEKFTRLGNNKLNEVINLVPEEWNCEAVQDIQNHINIVLKNLDKFIFELKKALL